MKLHDLEKVRELSTRMDTLIEQKAQLQSQDVDDFELSLRRKSDKGAFVTTVIKPDDKTNHCAVSTKAMLEFLNSQFDLQIEQVVYDLNEMGVQVGEDTVIVRLPAQNVGKTESLFDPSAWATATWDAATLTHEGKSVAKGSPTPDRAGGVKS